MTIAKELQTVSLKCDGARLDLVNFGATTQDWRLFDGGASTPMILGFEDPAAYLSSPYFLGAIAGRVSNRIGHGRYLSGGRYVQLDQNEGQTTLHGGSQSLGRVFWALEQLSDTQARLNYTSPTGENGFPGTALFEVLVTLSDRQLRYDMSATVDAETPISLAQHNYYNFGGTRDIWDYHVKIPTRQLLEQDSLGVSTGRILDTSGSAMDFREGQSLRSFSQDGLDSHFVFAPSCSDAMPQIAEIRAPNGLGIKVFSDQNGAQIYTAHGLPETEGGLLGETYGPARGLCFEPQGHPNAVNIPDFPSVMVTPEKPYQQSLVIEAIGL